MLKATSVTWAAMYTFGRLVMPANTNRDGVVCLIGYLKYVASTSQEVPSMMRVPTDMSAALGVCDAAKVLGMTKYTDHVYKVCDAMLRKAIPSSEDIDVVIAVKDQHARLFDIVVRDLAIQVWEDSIPDPDDFDIYLSNNPVLATAITQCNEAHAEKLRYLERVEYRKVQTTKQEAARAACERSIKEKSQCPLEKRKKFMPEERSHWVKTRGTQPHKGN
ncbi:hypothetical protein CC86DRAFT_420431 [Ophiobolus disseminans]|uniref:BTB domain-containing protein n=1 Tax=Ophiobolus disseminans TaxID=1469910 RepID=A0A6A6ZWT9_9PLEO|nr:hypothetical protein CC86DRAFT_420431 [Ophiobolus disseminans]